MYDYAIRFETGDAPGVAVFCRDLPELNSYGDNEEHALSEALDAIETTLSLYVDQRRAIPAATAAEPDEHVVRLPAVTVAKIHLWNTMVERGMRKADLVRLLNVKPMQVDRLVDFLHSSKMEQVEAALAALQRPLRVRTYADEFVKLKYMANTRYGRVLVVPGDADEKAFPEQYEWLNGADKITVGEYRLSDRYALWNVEEAVNAIEARGYFAFWLETNLTGPKPASAKTQKPGT